MEVLARNLLKTHFLQQRMHPVDGQHRFFLLCLINRVSCVGQCPLKITHNEKLEWRKDFTILPYRWVWGRFSAPSPRHPGWYAVCRCRDLSAIEDISFQHSRVLLLAPSAMGEAAREPANDETDHALVTVVRRFSLFRAIADCFATQKTSEITNKFFPQRKTKLFRVFPYVLFAASLTGCRGNSAHLYPPPSTLVLISLASRNQIGSGRLCFRCPLKLRTS